MLRFLSVILVVSIVSLTGLNGQAQDNDEFHSVLIHSDLPLWSSEDENVWPQHFLTDDSFGCSHRISTGDWKFTNFEYSEDDFLETFRLANYGVFHCGIMFSRFFEEDDSSDSTTSFFVFMDEIDYQSRRYELLALQIGVIPGSNYLLFAREKEQKPNGDLIVLQRECSKKKLRKGPEMDVWSTTYCAVNTKKDLINIARKMIKRPPLGKLEYMSSDYDNKE